MLCFTERREKGFACADQGLQILIACAIARGHICRGQNFEPVIELDRRHVGRLTAVRIRGCGFVSYYCIVLSLIRGGTVSRGCFGFCLSVFVADFGGEFDGISQFMDTVASAQHQGRGKHYAACRSAKEVLNSHARTSLLR